MVHLTKNLSKSAISANLYVMISVMPVFYISHWLWNSWGMNQKGTEGGLVLHIFMTIFPRNLWSLGKGEIVCLTKCLTRYLFKSRIVFVQMPKCICLVLPGLWVIWEAPGGGDPSGDQTEFTTCAHDNLRHCILSSFPAKEVSRLLFRQKKISQQQL